ncbi:MAG: hypothetical protein GF330_02850 [Candidatus Eisenbacteria bacterium]|nr:hypothetical protein [Candidatus Eisenbacteria bacterium]
MIQEPVADGGQGDGPEGEQRTAYRVQLENFEGPLDLLLHLIKEDELEIWEISISRITAQYLESLDRMRELDLEIAGEYLVMAAALMRIKSRKLLPRIEPADADEDEPATEEELIERLITYRAFKEAAALLRQRAEEAGPRFARGSRPALPDDFEYPLAEVDLFTLVSALHEIESRAAAAPPSVHEVQLEEVRLEDQVARVLAELETSGGRLAFARLFEEAPSRMEIAVTFLAILELARQQVIMILQHEAFDEIWVFARVHEQAVFG